MKALKQHSFKTGVDIKIYTRSWLASCLPTTFWQLMLKGKMFVFPWETIKEIIKTAKTMQGFQFLFSFQNEKYLEIQLHDTLKLQKFRITKG